MHCFRHKGENMQFSQESCQCPAAGIQAQACVMLVHDPSLFIHELFARSAIAQGVAWIPVGDP